MPAAGRVETVGLDFFLATLNPPSTAAPSRDTREIAGPSPRNYVLVLSKGGVFLFASELSILLVQRKGSTHMKSGSLSFWAQLTAIIAFCGAVHAGQIISTNRISDDFEANTVGNNAAGWNYALGGSSTGLIQNDGDAHGNYLALRLVSPSGQAELGRASGRERV